MKRIAFLALLLLAGEAVAAGGNYDLPRSKEGVVKCWHLVYERYGRNIQSVTQKTTGEDTLVSYCVRLSDGNEWVLTCHPTSGKLVTAGHRP